MIMKVFSVKDALTGFVSLYTAPNDAVAVRSFSALVSDPTTDVHRQPGDYELFCLGTFNTDDGVLQSDVSFLARALEMVPRGGAQHGE